MSVAADAANGSDHVVGVRSFCHFVARRGDLDLRFTPVPTAEQGMAGHAAVAARRGGAYRREVPVQGSICGLRLRGRVDGLFEAPPLLEEIKTCRGGGERVPAHHRALHRAQLWTYGALYCDMHALDAVMLRLVYYDVDSGEEHAETESIDAAQLYDFVSAHAVAYRAWAEGQAAHRRQRDLALRDMPFPHAAPHTGQAGLMAAVAETMRSGGTLLAQAPTGVGKTIGCLFPALKALSEGSVDKVFHLTPKGSAQREARRAVQTLRDRRGAALPLRVLTLSARSKACLHPDKACHGDACPLARGFYDRLPAAREAAQHEALLDADALRRVAGQHALCPYYLAQEMVRWSDVVIGDVNYWFDQSALLHALTVHEDWRVAVLVDEAHNLVERARDMYSATLSQQHLRALRAQMPGPVRHSLAALDQALSVFGAAFPDADAPPEALPERLLTALNRANTALGEHFSERAADGDQGLLDAWFELLAFQRLADSFGPHALLELTRSGHAGDLFVPQLTTVHLHNAVPAPHLRPRIAAAHALVAFSATLTPPRYYQDLLGLPQDGRWCDVPSPFAADQLQVDAVTHIGTTWRQRAGSVTPIAARIARQYLQRPGNYLAYFSSFEYMQSVAQALRRHFPSVPVREQARQMDEDMRRAFIDAFEPDGHGVAFAVLGGVFAEGVDLPGERLVGAFVSTLGLPPVTRRNDRMARRIAECLDTGDDGWNHAYLYPGLRKVVQAAGRVIRSKNDRGVLVLIDPRYARAEVRALLPASWGL